MPTSVRIDSRRFLNALNESAQAKVKIFESRVEELGRLANKRWKLAALHAKNLYIEDIDARKYYIADHIRESHGKVAITNIRPVEVVEEEKRGLFEDSCRKLINAIEENDQRGMQGAFDRMKSQRFSSRAIPVTGYVKCKDNVLRYVPTQPSGISLEESVKHRLVNLIAESLQNRVIVEDGEVISGSFIDGSPVSLPVTKWGARKVVARRMMEAAKNAYWSDGFQQRIYNIAKMVTESKIDEAVKYIASFLNEMEEFTLLNRPQVQTLIENALAAKSIFNQQLCNDTATLFFRTNMKVSRDKIVNEWRRIASKCSNPTLMENVERLDDSKNFENSYQKFLHSIFEAISNRDVAAGALATTLDQLRTRTPKIRESHELSNKLNGLIARLKDRNTDDAAIYEAEDLIATIQEELATGESLQNFDQMPQGGGPAGEDLGLNDVGGSSTGSPLDVSGGGSAPVININSPLIQIGGTSSAASKEDESDLDMLPEPPPGPDEDLDSLLGTQPETPPATQTAPTGPAAPAAGTQSTAGGGTAPGAAPNTTPRFESRLNKRMAFVESRPVHYEMRDEEDDDMPSDDPYALASDEKIEEGIRITDYGAPVITDDGDLQRIMSIMRRMATEGRSKNVREIAEASIKSLGLRIPAGKMPQALDEVVECFLESKPFEGAAPPFGKKGSKGSKGPKKPWENDSHEDDEDSEDSSKPWEDEGVAEDQYHKPRIPHMGYKKASVTKNESINWSRKQSDAMLGEYAGVKFIFDHGNGKLEPVILSEDSTVEIPIPKNLRKSAYAAAKMGNGNPKPFTKWIAESIQQLRPITLTERSALNEAVATITTNPDGTMSIKASDDVEMTTLDDDQDMTPVDSVEDARSTPEVDDTDKMPDFENGDDSLDIESDESDTELDLDAEDLEGDDLKGDEDLDLEDDEDLDLEDDEDLDLEDDEDLDLEDDEALEDDEDLDLEDDDDLDAEDDDDLDAEDDLDDEGMAEDHDITDPSSSKYTKHTKENLRQIPSSKMPGRADDQLEKIGPSIKKDDGSGTKPPTAKR